MALLDKSWQHQLHDDIVLAEQRTGRTLSDNLRIFLILALQRMLKQEEPLLQFQERLTVYRIEALRHVPHATMLRVMGDSALILSGLFPRHSHRALVSPRFYIATGQMAYRQLANVDIHWNWAEASVAFPVLVDTLLALPATCPLDEWTASKYADFSRIAQRYVAIHNITVGNNLAV